MGKEVETTRSDPNFKRTFCSREGDKNRGVSTGERRKLFQLFKRERNML